MDRREIWVQKPFDKNLHTVKYRLYLEKFDFFEL